MKCLRCVILCQLFPFLLLSQEAARSKTINKHLGIELAIFVGGQNNVLDGLNTRLQEFRRPQPKSTVYNGGAGIAFRYREFLVGFDASVLYRGANELGDIQGSYLHGFISANVLKYKKLFFCPQLGIGSQTININARGGSSLPDFNDYLLLMREDITFSNKNTMIDAAICVRLLSGNNNLPIPIFRAGYRYGLKESNWKVKDSGSSNGPSDRVNNFYCQLMVGLGN